MSLHSCWLMFGLALSKVKGYLRFCLILSVLVLRVITVSDMCSACQSITLAYAFRKNISKRWPIPRAPHRL